MARSLLQCAVASAALLLFVAGIPARARADDAAPPRLADRVFSESDSTIVVQTGQLFLVALDANPSTGYHWDGDGAPDSAVCVLRGTAYLGATSGLIGAGGRELRLYEVTGPGTATIKLSYVPPGRGRASVRHVVFSVTATPSDAR